MLVVNDLDTAKAEAEEILKSSGMQEARINFVIDTFANAIEIQNKKIAEVEQNSEQLAQLHQQFINLCKQILIRRQPNVTSLPQQNYQPQSYQPQQVIIQAQPTQNNFPTKINKILIGAICVLAVALFFVIGNNFETEPEVSELSLNGIELGMTESEVIKILGKPESIDYGRDDYSYYYDHWFDDYFHQDRYGTSVKFSNDGKMIGFDTNNPKFKTQRGIHAGSTEKDMRDAYEIHSAPPINDSEWDMYDKSFETADGRKGKIVFRVETVNYLVDSIFVHYVD